jgi:fused signal recognition particle receptor
MELLDRFKSGLQKTAQFLNTDIRDLFKQQGRLVDEQFLSELFAILIKTGMGTTAAIAIRDRIQAKFRGRIVEMAEILAIVKTEFRRLFIK